MKTIDAEHGYRTIQESYKQAPVLPDPSNGYLIAEFPNLDETNEQGLYVGAVARELVMVPNQFLVWKSTDDRFPIRSIVTCNGNSISNLIKYKDPDTLESRVFGYIKTDHVLATIPLQMSLFHETPIE